MLNHCLEWDKRLLTNFDHNRQWFNTLIQPSHESTAVTVDSISCLSKTREVITMLYHAIHPL